MEALLLELASHLADALAAGISKLMGGGSLDDALAAAIESIEDKRAKAKFSDFRVG